MSYASSSHVKHCDVTEPIAKLVAKTKIERGKIDDGHIIRIGIENRILRFFFIDDQPDSLILAKMISTSGIGNFFGVRSLSISINRFQSIPYHEPNYPACTSPYVKDLLDS